MEQCMPWSMEGMAEFISSQEQVCWFLSSNEKPNFMSISIWNYFCILSNIKLFPNFPDWNRALYFSPKHPAWQVSWFCYKGSKEETFSRFLVQKRSLGSHCLWELFLAMSKARCDIMIDLLWATTLLWQKHKHAFADIFTQWSDKMNFHFNRIVFHHCWEPTV